MGKRITTVLVTVLALCGMLRGAAEAALIERPIAARIVNGPLGGGNNIIYGTFSAEYPLVDPDNDALGEYSPPLFDLALQFGGEVGSGPTVFTVADDVRGPGLPYMELVIGGGAWPLNPVVLDYVVLLDSPMGVLDVSSTPVHQIVGFEFRIEDAFAFFDPEFVNPELQEIWPDGIFLGDVYVTYAEDSAASAPPAAAALLAGLAALGLFRRRRR